MIEDPSCKKLQGWRRNRREPTSPKYIYIYKEKSFRDMEHMNMLSFLLGSEFVLDSLWVYSSHVFSHPQLSTYAHAIPEKEGRWHYSCWFWGFFFSLKLLHGCHEKAKGEKLTMVQGLKNLSFILSKMVDISWCLDFSVNLK